MCILFYTVAADTGMGGYVFDDEEEELSLLMMFVKCVSQCRFMCVMASERPLHLM